MASQQQTRRYSPSPPPPTEDMSDKTVHDLHPPRFLKPNFDFNGKPAVVTIRRVTKEAMWDKHKQEWERGNVIYFEGYDRGIKGIKTNTDVLDAFWGENIRNWIGKKVKLVHVYEDVGGKRHHLVRISEEKVSQQNELPQKQEAPPPNPASADQLEELESFGLQLYGEEWDDKSIELALSVSGQEISDIVDLNEAQVTRLINGIINKINEGGVEDNTPSITVQEEPPSEDHIDNQPPAELDDEDEDFQEVHNGK